VSPRGLSWHIRSANDEIEPASRYHLPWQAILEPGGQIAGCRINHDGYEFTGAKEPEVVAGHTGSTIGPGNSIAGTEGVAIKYGFPDIRDNYFGFDPVTEETVFCQYGVEFRALQTHSGPMRVVGNVFASKVGIHAHIGLDETSVVDVRDNYFGGSASKVGIEGNWVGTVTVGPGNQFSGLERAIDVELYSDTVFTITQNSVAGGQGSAFSVVGSPLSPPLIAHASSSRVQGTCLADGVIEVFTDPGLLASEYVGSTDCVGGNWAQEGTFGSGNATATLTTSAGTSELAVHVPLQP